MAAAACERFLVRLVGAAWDDDVAELRHFRARGRLASEFLRRKALWANALGVTERWAFADIAPLVDPAVEGDPVWLERLEAEVGHELKPLVRKVIADMFRWVSLGDAPYQQFPGLDDPYEPMVQVFELGGEFWQGQASIELPVGGVAYLSLAERLAQAPLSIDAATLAALDEEDRIQAEESRARIAAQLAKKKE
ncbi:hypothetical protein ACWGID_21935 [Kribbella sp. NPDC054772]